MDWTVRGWRKGRRLRIPYGSLTVTNLVGVRGEDEEDWEDGGKKEGTMPRREAF